MSEKNTVSRSLHDVGLAAWFGGSLMGAVGLNGAAGEAKDPAERTRLSSVGWARWAPVSTAAIGAHAIGGLGLVGANRRRVVAQPGAGSNTVAKAALTGVAVGLTAYAGYLGKQVAEQSHEGAEGATEPKPDASPQLAKAQQQLKYAQWALPVVTGTLIVLGSVQGEQQKPEALVKNQLKRLPASVRAVAHAS